MAVNAIAWIFAMISVAGRSSTVLHWTLGVLGTFARSGRTLARYSSQG
jgi:hypothetical protein